MKVDRCGMGLFCAALARAFCGLCVLLCEMFAIVRIELCLNPAGELCSLSFRRGLSTAPAAALTEPTRPSFGNGKYQSTLKLPCHMPYHMRLVS